MWSVHSPGDPSRLQSLQGCTNSRKAKNGAYIPEACAKIFKSCSVGTASNEGGSRKYLAKDSKRGV